MAKRHMEAGQLKDKNGNAFNPAARSTGAGTAYRIIEPNFYYANITGLTESTSWRAFNSKGENFPNTAVDDKGVRVNAEGKWEYLSLTPNFELFNDNGTIINRQNFQLGVLDADGVLTRPDGDNSKPALWSEGQFLLGAMGLLSTDEEGNFSFSYDPDLILDRVVKIKTGVGGYIKGKTGFDDKQLKAVLEELNDGEEYTFDELFDLVKLYNIDHELEGDAGLKLKNIIVSVYPADERAINENGWFVDPATQAVFTSEVAFDSYNTMVAASEAAEGGDISGDIPF